MVWIADLFKMMIALPSQRLNLLAQMSDVHSVLWF